MAVSAFSLWSCHKADAIKELLFHVQAIWANSKVSGLTIICVRRSTNSFRRKLFGQPNDSDGEPVTRLVSAASVRVHPHSTFRKYWEIATILLVIYTVFVLPFRAAFYLDYYKELETRHHLIQQLQVTKYRSGVQLFDMAWSVCAPAHQNEKNFIWDDATRIINNESLFDWRKIQLMKKDKYRQPNSIRRWTQCLPRTYLWMPFSSQTSFSTSI